MPDYNGKLSSIADEVNDFHPLLTRLFRVHPEISDFEYTHGNRELGADFVLAQPDNSWGGIDYIGVIAKVNNIAQDYSDVARQIEECRVPRVFHGKDRINITEIWVITTGTISKNAQEKLVDQYRNFKIKFIGRDRLISFIDRYLSIYWSELNLDVGSHLQTLRERNDELDRQFSLVPYRDDAFYIEQDVDRIEDDSYRRNGRSRSRRKGVNFREEIRRHEFLLVEGGMGSGKSKFLRHLVSVYATPEVFAVEKLIPVPITFKELLDEFNGNIHAVVDRRVRTGVPGESLEGATFLLLIDAVDEKNIPIEEQLESLTLIHSQVTEAKDIKAVVTSRFLRGMERTHPLSRSLARYEIRPLSVRRVVEFLTRICTRFNLGTRLVEDLKKSPLFRELPRSPIAAIILAQLLQEKQEDLPSNVTELYSKYTELMLGRWDVEKGLQSMKEYEALSTISMHIAQYMVTNEIKSLALDEARAMFDDYLSGRNLGVTTDNLFAKLRARSELIVIDDAQGTFSFKHRTFAEFLLARSFQEQGGLVIDQRAYQPYWMNTFFFAVGLKRDAPRLLQQLIETQPDTEGGRWVKVINLANYLLAGYATPYKVIEDGVYRAAVEAAEVFLGVVEGKTESPLREVTRMHLLFIVQYLFRQGYSYEFLAKAIDSAALRVATEPGLDEVRPYALFFLSVARIELKEEGGFDYILEELKGTLPLDVSLAIRHEGANLKDRSKLIRKHDKRVQAMIAGPRDRKGPARLNSRILALYERQIQRGETEPTS